MSVLKRTYLCVYIYTTWLNMCVSFMRKGICVYSYDSPTYFMCSKYGCPLCGVAACLFSICVVRTMWHVIRVVDIEKVVVRLPSWCWFHYLSLGSSFTESMEPIVDYIVQWYCMDLKLMNYKIKLNLFTDGFNNKQCFLV